MIKVRIKRDTRAWFGYFVEAREACCDWQPQGYTLTRWGAIRIARRILTGCDTPESITLSSAPKDAA